MNPLHAPPQKHGGGASVVTAQAQEECYSPEAERSLMSLALCGGEPDLLAQVVNILNRSCMFFALRHSMIWQAVMWLLADGANPDLIIVSERLARTEARESAMAVEQSMSSYEDMVMNGRRVGAAKRLQVRQKQERVPEGSALEFVTTDLLDELAFQPAQPVDPIAVALVVRRIFAQRLMQRVLVRGQSECRAAGDIRPVATLIGQRLERCVEVQVTKRKNRNPGDAVMAKRESDDGDITRPQRWRPSWAATRRFGAWASGRYYVIGARPGVGKTSVAVQLARDAILGDDKGRRLAWVMFACLDMSADDLNHWVVSCEACLDANLVLGDALDEAQVLELEAGAERVSRWPIQVLDSKDLPGQTVHEVFDYAKEMKREHGGRPGMVIIDHLHKIKGVSAAADELQVISDATRACKLHAAQQNDIVVSLAQLSRIRQPNRKQQSDVDDPGPPPRLENLRGCGSIEEDADAVWLLHKGDIHSPPQNDYDGKIREVHVIVAKNRFGSLGQITLHHRPSICRVKEPLFQPQG